ncbi:GLPGLI family protein [Leadbetterella byssophila]|uniref:GLPGLI family protein n=1 Tax=Leadbetterella byssophila (strain DSM 17132 / JCM 16389 / KACC 11308 / NBRC 106382 / 4M15) TaxID=649349 RepID=E4RRG1_LEAB4|nr:GLPGLI family protein [Leadbetterella byssophila]ADQ18494.1 Protein of unknown function, Porph ging [Leadbetterella byssophila DSM 17132]
MKKFSLLLMLLATTAFGQNFEGVVKYSRTFDPSKNFANNPNASRMRSQMGNMTMRPTIFNMFVKDQERAFKVDPNQDPGEASVVINGERRTFSRRLPKDELYFNDADKTFKKFEEYAQQPFQVSGKTTEIRWKVDPTQTRPILGYECMMATATESEQRTMPVPSEDGKMVVKDTVIVNELTAWFTDAIPSSAGPDKYSGLPGMILALDINNGVTTYVATNVEQKSVSSDDLKINSKGKKMTPEQLEKLKKEHMAEQMKNFRGGPGGGGMVIMGRPGGE